MVSFPDDPGTRTVPGTEQDAIHARFVHHFDELRSAQILAEQMRRSRLFKEPNGFREQAFFEDWLRPCIDDLRAGVCLPCLGTPFLSEETETNKCSFHKV